MSEAIENNPQQAASVMIAADNINQRQAIAVAVGKGLKDAGFTDITMVVDKSDDPSRIDILPENAESLLGSMKALNPGLFDAPISIVAFSSDGGGADLASDIVVDAKEEGVTVHKL
jgi:hypothetical protein